VKHTGAGSFIGHAVAGQPISGVSLTEQVHCECGDPECGCGGVCSALAIYEWGSVAVAAWQYLCHRCASRMVERGTAPYHGEEDDTDA
jgi:hypothetical protein